MRKEILFTVSILTGLLTLSIILSISTTSQTSFCQDYHGDNICDDTPEKCGSAYIEGVSINCNECSSGGYDCSKVKSLPKDGPDSPLCKAYYGDNICDDKKEKCGNDYKVDEDGKPISLDSCQECSTGGFACTTVSKPTTGPESSLCQTFGSLSDPFCDDTKKNCASGYVEGVSEPSCQECSTGKWKDCKVISNEITCEYEVSENICLRNYHFVSTKEVDVRLKVDKTIVSKNSIIELEFKIQNKAQTPLKLFLNKPAVEDKSLHIFLEQITVMDTIPQEIPANEEMTFKLKGKITPVFVEDEYFLNKISLLYDKKDVESLQTVFFIKSETTNSCGLLISTPGKCTSDKVFFAGAECVNHKDCAGGSCVNGYCIKKIGGVSTESGKGLDFGGWKVTAYYIDVHPFLKDELKVLVLVDSAIDKKEIRDALEETLKLTSNWYEKQSISYLNEDVVDLVFNTNFVDAKVIEECVGASDSGKCILERISKSINIKEYDKFALFFHSDLINKFCGGIVAGCSGVSIVYIDTTSMLEPTINADTLIHEMFHSFGQQKHLTNYKGVLTRSVKSDTFISKEFELNSLYATEVGWGDIDRNGIVDIKQVINEPIKDIKLNRISYEIIKLPDNKMAVDLYFELKDEKGNFLIPTENNPMIIEVKEILLTSPSFGGTATNNVVIRKEVPLDSKEVPYKFSIEYRNVKKTFEGSVLLK